MQIAPALQQIDRTWVMYRGRKLSYFSGCDYYRMSSHPAVLRACRTGLKLFGLNVAASRVTTGNHEVYEQLETRLAHFFGFPAALLFSSGYTANLGIAQAFRGEFTHVFVDERSHASLMDAAAFLGARVISFRHRDAKSLARRLGRIGRGARILVATDGVFPLDGSVAPLQQYAAVLPRSAWMLVDDAHGAGVLGSRGRGTLELEGVRPERVIQTITLSKAFGAYGGAVLGPKSMRSRAVVQSRCFAGNTPMPLPLAAAALSSIELVEHGGYRQRLAEVVDWVKSALQQAGRAIVHSPAPIVTLTPSSQAEARRWQRMLLRREIYPPFVQYPGFPKSGCFRFALSSEHTPEQIQTLIDCLVRW